MKGWATTAKPPASWMASTVSSTGMCIRIARSTKRATTWMPGGKAQVTSSPATTSMPSLAPTSVASSSGERVSWSVMQMTDSPMAAAARTSSTAVTMPSLARVWLWASAALNPAPSRMRSGTPGPDRCGRSLEDGARGAQDGDVGHHGMHHHPPRGRGEEPPSDHVDDVVLAEEDDAHEDQAGPAEEDPGAARVDAPEGQPAEGGEGRVQRGEGGGRVGVEQAVEGADVAGHGVLRVDQVGDPAQQVVLCRVPGRRRRHQHEEDETDHAHPERRRDDAQVLGAVLEPEHEPHQQLHREMAEVDDGRGHRQHVKGGAAHRVLQDLAGIVAEEEPL